MSTKSSIKWRDWKSADEPGFHLYDDLMDTFNEEPGDPEPPVYLSLDGVQIIAMHTTRKSGASVTIVLTRAIARELGLLPPSPAAPFPLTSGPDEKSAVSAVDKQEDA